MTAKRVDTQLQGITDLTLITPVKPGFVKAFDTISHVARLRAVLKTLNALRLGARESSDPPTPYADVVSRFRIVHSFRWAIIEPGSGSAEPHKLLLNVCFDGGWEPYMRVIWHDLGSMLDLILCHCEGYRLAKETPFERYIEWVRENEISSDFLYLESGLSSSDHEYLAALELQQRKSALDADLNATRLRNPAPGAGKPVPPAGMAPVQMALIGLTPLAALYALERYFLKGQPDGLCLIRATRDILAELVQLDTAQLFSPEHPVRKAHFRMLAWFEAAPEPKVLAPRKLPYQAEQVQAGILSAYPPLDDGVLVLLRVVNRAQAIAWLGSSHFSTEAEPAVEPGIYRNVALSLAGLRALGVPAARLDRFPQAFREGMEARAGVLGDLRHNHPKYWQLPLRNWRPADQRRIDLASVHVLIQIRRSAERPDKDDMEARIAELEQGSGLQVLSRQDMRRNRNKDDATQESFGFIDGISQPSVDAKPGIHWSDQVPRGELLLGYPTRQDSSAVPELPDPLLDNGSFLVLRKLRQRVPRLHRVLDQQAGVHGLTREQLLAKMMGRKLDGTPLATPTAGPNDFNYKGDEQASLCPFHAHVRRANPREALMPRLARRGMSYGPKFDPAQPDDEDRGLIFMAYNASLSEQFETLQRWLAGGNSSGGYSGQSDPFLGVAVKGEPRIYRFEDEHEKVIRLDLGEEPFVELQWGGYFFAPSITALGNLSALTELPLPAAQPAPLRAPALDDGPAWQQWLEDSSTRDRAWAFVRAQPGGVLRCAYGVLVGDSERVMEVFRDRWQRYSVSGYGERMRRSVGLGFLGMDDDSGRREQAPLVNAAIERISEPAAFALAYRMAGERLAELRAGAVQLDQKDAPIDLEQLSEVVLARLCTHWFGLPDGRFMWDEGWNSLPAGQAEPPRCPRGFFAVSRYVFGPQPSPIVEQVGADKGQALQRTVAAWLSKKPKLPELAKEIVAALKPLEAQQPGLTARTLTGVMLGFPPTVHGNLLSTLMAWSVTKKLWDLQQDWPKPAADQAYAQAVAVLRQPLLGTMLRQPVPAMVWRRSRSAHRLGEWMWPSGKRSSSALSRPLNRTR